MTAAHAPAPTATPKQEPSRRVAPTHAVPAPAALVEGGVWDGLGPALRLPVQAKAVVGPPDDAYEREADAVAQRVVAGEAAPAVSRLTPGALAQRQPEEDEEVQRTCAACEEEPVQREPDDDPYADEAESGSGWEKDDLHEAYTQRGRRDPRTFRAGVNGPDPEAFRAGIGSEHVAVKAASEWAVERGTPATLNRDFSLTRDELSEIVGQRLDLAAKGHEDQLDAYLASMARAFRAAGLDTIEAQAAYLAHAAGETRFAILSEGQRESFVDDPAQVAFTTEAAGPRRYAHGTGSPHRFDVDPLARIDPRGNPTYEGTFIGRGPVQVTHEFNYVRSLVYLEEMAAQASPDDAAWMREAVAAIKADPREAANPAYSFLFSAAFMHQAGGVRASAGLPGSLPTFYGQDDASRWVAGGGFDIGKKFDAAAAKLAAATASGDAEAVRAARSTYDEWKGHKSRADIKAGAYERAIAVLARKLKAKAAVPAPVEEPVQRQPLEEDEAVQTAPAGVPGPSAAAPAAAPRSAGLDAAATRALEAPGAGAPMHAPTRDALETHLGTDLSDVRVHDDARAHAHARALHARAFTHNRDIWLGPGESQDDLGLMAHETTHVLQQGGVVRRKEGGGAGDGSAGGVGSGAGQGDGGAAVPGGKAAGNEGGKAASGGEGAVPAPQGSGAVAGGVDLLMPEPPEGLSAEEQARLEGVEARAAEKAEAEATLPPAEEHVVEAREAVQEPDAETQARAEHDLVEELGGRPAPSPEIEQLCERIRTVIRNKRPTSEDSLLNTDFQQVAGEAGRELNTAVEGDAERVQGEYDELDQQPQGTPEQQAQPLDPPPEAPETAPVDATAATPDGVAPEDVSLDADVAATQEQIEGAGMTTEPAELVESGPIAEARGAHGELEEAARRVPPEVLAEQQETLASAEAGMAALQASALQSLVGARQETAGGTVAHQGAMKGDEEATRAAVSAQAQTLFDAAQTRVDALLTPLAATAMQQWTAGVAVLSSQFDNDLAEFDAYKRERYEGASGAVVELWDSATGGLPQWMRNLLDRAEERFGEGVCRLITEISVSVNTVIETCEQIIEDARAQIGELFAGLPEELQGWAAEQQALFAERLDGLTQRAHATRDDFTRDLAQRAAQAVEEVRNRVHEEREKAKGLLERIADAVEAFAEDPAKFIIDGLLELAGISPGAFWGVVNRIGDAIDAIAADPVSFASNLAAALAQGFQQFFDNFAQHLMGGFFDWLFSGLGTVGVQIPSDTSPRSLITFFLQLMGITWANIRPILVRHVGEENVALLEKAWELIQALIELGPEGLFEMVKEQLDPANLIQMVIDAALDFMVEALIKAVTPRIIALFNPAGAIVQAIEAIYRVLSWVFNNAARIFALVETVVNGITNVIAGNIGGMANAVEGALRGILVPVIDFLAGYLGMGDLPEKIAGVIGGMQQWVLSGIDRAVGFLVSKARGLLSALGFGGEEEQAEEEEPIDPADHRAVAQRAARDLKRGGPSDDYDALRREKEAQAPAIEQRYSAVLEEGVGLSIVFGPRGSDDDDFDLDFRVIVAPNTTEVADEVPVNAEDPEPIHAPAETEEVSAGEAEPLPAATTPADERFVVDASIKADLVAFWNGEIARDPANAARYNDYISRLTLGLRPTWRQSEIEMQYLRSMGGTLPSSDQVSYLHGREVSHGTAGSTRPDIVEGTGGGHSVEVKRYRIKNLSSLIRTLQRQVTARREHLPYDRHRQQAIIVDLRGQAITSQQVADVKTQIAQAVDLPRDNIEVVTY